MAPQSRALLGTEGLEKLPEEQEPSRLSPWPPQETLNWSQDKIPPDFLPSQSCSVPAQTHGCLYKRKSCERGEEGKRFNNLDSKPVPHPQLARGVTFHHQNLLVKLLNLTLPKLSINICLFFFIQLNPRAFGKHKLQISLLHSWYSHWILVHESCFLLELKPEPSENNLVKTGNRYRYMRFICFPH